METQRTNQSKQLQKGVNIKQNFQLIKRRSRPRNNAGIANN